ncbi:MAG: 2-C-methyl-D-erythritol 4-phosphate cytidylyltransferase [Eubacteriales bacterium]|nr:2-C-methyl-D-erythritol 4-phosphate cytidylyltransferase [Eubacteriales bacterium]
MYQDKKIIVIIAAAGSGKRMGRGISKQYLEIDGEMILERSLKAFVGHPYIDGICLAVKKEDLEFCKDRWFSAAGFEKIFAVIPGGEERQDTVACGIDEVSQRNVPDILLIHDGARPFVTSDEISRLIEATYVYQAAALAVPVKDTIKRAQDDYFEKTIERKTLFAVQTPQGFSFELLKKAYQKAREDGFYGTDDAQLVEHFGERVRLVMGEYSNKKITTKEDLIKKTEWRSGSGFDVHAFAEGRRVVLGGVAIPFERGLLGHSDADVLTHAVMDALLGACGLEDIGFHFSDKDPKYKDANSLELLSQVRQLVVAAGFQIANVDVTLIGERPKIAPYKEEMRKNLALHLAISKERINIKGTTTERLGFCGRGEGLAAMASASVFCNNDY